MALCINDEAFADRYENWKLFFPKVINKDRALENGYFWIVKEIQLIEVSAVLFGSNEITPTLEISEPTPKSFDNIPIKPTPKSLDYNYLINNLKI